MRTTNNMVITNMMRNLNRNMTRLDKRQMQMSTGKRIHKPSDDPVAIARSLKIRTDINQLHQHRKNIDDAASWLETTELALQNKGEAMHRVRDLTVQAANGVLTQEETLKISAEIKELKDQIIGLSNTTYAGRYVFSGKNTNQPLLDQEGNYNVDLYNANNPNAIDHKMIYEVGIAEKIDVNVLGTDFLETNSLTLNFPRQEGEETEWTLHDAKVNITMEEENPDTYSATVTVVNEEGKEIVKAIPEDGDPRIKSDLSKEIADTLNELIKNDGEWKDEEQTPLRSTNPLKNYNFSGVDFKETQLDLPGADEEKIWRFGGEEFKIEYDGNNYTVSKKTVDDNGNDTDKLIGSGGNIAEIFNEYVYGDETEDNSGIKNPNHPLKNYTFDINEGNLVATKQDGLLVAQPEKAGLIALLDRIEDNMINGKNEELSDQLKELDTYKNQLLTMRSEVGAKVNRMELANNRISDDIVNFRTLQSNLEDADMGEVIMELMNEENVYRAALNVGARIIQPTILDFLR
ncbi:flagellar hook-associated protein FlgL [Serpentinicella sp. ANB-PHB4]|uniref:flagellar hook-associated protein FlgL n=1 Tax=Serpentinicella sp. ANB-PHB4 TaxID=3074076 RepID=UPI00285922DE|nr:flagellar hook-associated protein FlgL [Serpentinicella sp. ANB-PHB4]MDR5659772.1 flagellar hook-associated protein FlgL [Serpentinicella sp. ANB-PHB4]